MKPTTDFPFLLDNPRAWRTYLGGRMLDALHGDSNGEDGHFPEEWILSTVAARNAGREQFPEEGMSHLRGTDVTLRSVLESDTEGYLGKGAAQPTLGVLTKLIDSAERLTLQVHPDKPTALRLFQSQYGKTECWHILSGHPVNGEEPCIYYGFQPDMTRARWEALFHAQDIPGMLAGMQKYPVHPGDTILIEGGMPHAIGAGCFLVEIQEPTDYTIRVERTTPSGFAVADSMCHQGLGFEKMFECFHYEPHSREEIHDRWFIKPETVLKTAGGSITGGLSQYAALPSGRSKRLRHPDGGLPAARQRHLCAGRRRDPERKRPQPASEKDRPALCPRWNGKIYTGCGGSAEGPAFLWP